MTADPGAGCQSGRGGVRDHNVKADGIGGCEGLWGCGIRHCDGVQGLVLRVGGGAGQCAGAGVKRQACGHHRADRVGLRSVPVRDLRGLGDHHRTGNQGRVAIAGREVHGWLYCHRDRRGRGLPAGGVRHGHGVHGRGLRHSRRPGNRTRAGVEGQSVRQRRVDRVGVAPETAGHGRGLGAHRNTGDELDGAVSGQGQRGTRRGGSRRGPRASPGGVHRSDLEVIGGAVSQFGDDGTGRRRDILVEGGPCLGGSCPVLHDIVGDRAAPVISWCIPRHGHLLVPGCACECGRHTRRGGLRGRCPAGGDDGDASPVRAGPVGVDCRDLEVVSHARGEISHGHRAAAAGVEVCPRSGG